MDGFSIEHDVPQIMPRDFLKCDDLSPILRSQEYAQGDTRFEEILEYRNLESNARKSSQLKLSNGFRDHKDDTNLEFTQSRETGSSCKCSL